MRPSPTPSPVTRASATAQPTPADRGRPGPHRLDGRVALITGSSRGIGAAIAETFARLGASVAVHGRDRDAAEQVARTIRADGGTALVTLGDVTDGGTLRSIRDHVEAELGPVEILVANAGASLTPPGPIEQIDERAWRETIDANLTATFLTLRCFLPGMKQRGQGTVITIGSSAGRQANPHVPLPYGAAKAAIALLTQNLAVELGPFGIRVNCIAPETILTNTNRRRIPADQQASMAGHHPLRRLGTPHDVADAAAFLAGDQSSWITGTVLDIAGGALLV